MCAIGVGAADSSREGLALFHKMQAALGGAEKIAAIRDFEQQVRAVAINGNTGQRMGEVVKRTRWIRPNVLRVDQVGPGSTYVLYFDGKSGWEILPGTTSAVELAGGELKFAQAYIRGFRLNTWLADRDPSWRITSPAANVVRLSDGDLAHQMDLVLDSSFLPSKTRTVTLSDPANPVPAEEAITEWETIAGARLPRRFSVYRRDALVGEATDEKTNINQGLRAEDLAVKPADFKPVLLASGEPQKTSLDPVVQFLLTSAAADFRAHRPPDPVRFREVRMGHLMRADGKEQYMLCGQFLPAAEGGRAEWTPFATIKTSGYEQWIGGQAANFCGGSSVLWDDVVGDLAAPLQSRLDSLR